MSPGLTLLLPGSGRRSREDRGESEDVGAVRALRHPLLHRQRRGRGEKLQPAPEGEQGVRVRGGSEGGGGGGRGSSAPPETFSPVRPVSRAKLWPQISSRVQMSLRCCPLPVTLFEKVTRVPSD